MDCFVAIPCFHEAERLPVFLNELCEALEDSPYRVGVMVVDDGSFPEERAAVEEAVRKSASRWKVAVQFKGLPVNRGKGFAIRSAWATAPENCRFLAFLDADGAADADSFLHVLDVAMKESGEVMVIGSRRMGDKKVARRLMRRLMSRAFLMATRWRYGIDLRDTQCGCKVVPARFFRDVENRLVEDRFGLDLELILRAREKSVRILEVGINWHEKGGSRLGLARAGALFLKVAAGRIGRQKKA